MLVATIVPSREVNIDGVPSREIQLYTHPVDKSRFESKPQVIAVVPLNRHRANDRVVEIIAEANAKAEAEGYFVGWTGVMPKFRPSRCEFHECDEGCSEPDWL